MIYPKSLSDAISSLELLPGVGSKSAERYALSLMELSDDNINVFVDNIKNAKANLKRCSICGHLTDKDECEICTSEFRNPNLICVVEDYKSVFTFEKSFEKSFDNNTFNGKYHVLNGLIAPMDGIGPDDINLMSLLKRLKNQTVNDKDADMEIILALKPSIEGETTTLYITKQIEEFNKKEKRNIKVSRLTCGIPMGAEIDYLDLVTLERALIDRKELLD